MVELRPDIRLEESEDIHVFVADAELSDSDRKELRFWQTSPEGPGGTFYESIRVKGPELPLFEAQIPRIGLRPGLCCLEVGAGQAWAALMLKRAVPGAVVHACELSADALRVAAHWERAMGVGLDGKWAASSRNLPFAAAQFDRVFAFQAFHHFGRQGDFSAPLGEMLRVLKLGGRLLLLCEPSAPGFLLERVRRGNNRTRQVTLGADVDEDVLVPGRLEALARAQGADVRIEFDTSWAFRDLSLKVVLIFALVRAFPWLGRLTATGIHATLTKPAAGP